jgi:hypothetical protein
MPIPVVTGVFSIGGAIGAAVTSVITFLVARTSAKVVLIGAAVGSIIALTVGLITGLTALGDALAVVLPSEFVALSSSLLPRNLNACITAVVTASATRWVYDRHLQVVSMLTSN